MDIHLCKNITVVDQDRRLSGGIIARRDGHTQNSGAVHDAHLWLPSMKGKPSLITDVELVELDMCIALCD